MNNVFPETSLRFDGVPALVDYIDKQEFKDRKITLSDLHYRNGQLNGNPIKQTGIETLLTRVGVPYRFAEKIPEDLLDHNINRLLNEYGSHGALLRLHNGKVRAVLSEKYQPVDDKDIIHHIEKRMNNHLAAKNVIFTDRFTRISLVDKNKPVDVIPGDTWFGGMDIFNSGTGFHAFLLHAFLWRLVCTNGAIATKTLGSARRIHRGNPILKYKSDITAISRNTGVHFQDKILALTSVRIDDRYRGSVETKLVPVLGTEPAKQFREDELTGKSNLIGRVVKTRYDVVDAITRKAHEFENDRFEKQRQLEVIGGNLIFSQAA